MRKLFFLILLVPGMFVHAQSGNVDSLRSILRHAKNDTERVNALNELSTVYRRVSNYDTALYYARQAILLTDSKILYELGKARAFIALGNAYSLQGDWPESLRNYFFALKLLEKTGDKKGIATCYGNIGNIYYYQNNLPDALSNHQKALRIKQELNDKRGMAITFNNIANVHTNQSNYREAEKNFAASLAIVEELSVQDARTQDQAIKAVALQGLGNISYYEEHFEQALEKYEATLVLQERLGSKLGISNSQINIGATLHKLGKPREAEACALQGLALAKEIGSVEMVKEANETLSLVAEETGRFREALAYYRDYVSARDSLLNEENTKESVRAQMNYEFEKKETAVRLEQEKKEAVAQAESRRQRIILLAISGLGLMTLAFAIFAYRSFVQKKRVNEAITRQKELIEEKQKEILDSIRYAKRIQTALLPHEKYVHRNLKRLLYN